MDKDLKEKLKFWLKPGTFMKVAKEEGERLAKNLADVVKKNEGMPPFAGYKFIRQKAEIQAYCLMGETIRLTAYGLAMYKVAKLFL